MIDPNVQVIHITNVIPIPGTFKLILEFNLDGKKEVRIVDITSILDGLNEDHIGYPVVRDLKVFSSVEVSASFTIHWPTVGIDDLDVKGNPTFASFDLDPWVLYEHSENINF